MATIPISLPTGRRFLLPLENLMIKELSEIERQIGIGPEIPVPAPRNAAVACLFSFLTILGNGVLNSMKVFLNLAIAEYGVLIIALKSQILQLSFLQGSILGAEQAALTTARNAFKSEVNNIENMISSSITKDLSRENAVVAQQLLSSLQTNCPPVSEFYFLLSANLVSLDQLLAELSFTIEQDTALLNTLNLALAWAEAKQRYLKWYVSSISFVAASR